MRQTRRRTTRAELAEAPGAPLARRRAAELPATLERQDFEKPDFDMIDMGVGFLFAASIGSGNIGGAIVSVVGFVVQKQLRRDTAWLTQATDFVIALVPVSVLPRGMQRLLPLNLRAMADERQLQAMPATGGAVANPTGAEFTPQPERAAPPTAQARKRSGPPKPEEVALERGVSLLDRPLYSTNPDEAWGPTLIAAKPRHGKSQVQIARLVQDIEADCETVWMSTHATLYHSKDQPVDLRPLADRFELLGDAKAIKERLTYYVDEVMEERLARYRRGEDVGHPIAIHVGEWPALYAQYGEDVAAPMRRLLREAPKTQVIVSTLDAQDAQVGTIGLGSGLRNCFWHVLLGNVDEHSWRAFTDEPYREVPARSWYVPGQGTLRFPQATERARRLVAAAPVAHADQLPLPAPALARAPTAQLVRRQAEAPTVVARSAATPEPMPDLLSALLAAAPVDDRQADRQARLQALLAAQPAKPPPTAQSVTVEREGGQVTVNVVQSAPVAPPRRERAKTPKEITHARRLRAAYIQAAQAGEKFDPTYKRLGGSRNQMWELFNANKPNSAS